MALFARDPNRFYPPKWTVFDKAAPYVDVSFFGFEGVTGDVNRFAARYRVAKSFRGVKLDGFTNSTMRGYGALIKLSLTYSAFEKFVRLIGRGQKGLADLLASYNADELMAEVRTIDSENKFYTFIFDRVNERHQKELTNYFNLDPCNPTYLASSVRHIFLHGDLTPNVSGGKSDDVVKLCKLLYGLLMKIMDEEFVSRMAKFEAIEW